MEYCTNIYIYTYGFSFLLFFGHRKITRYLKKNLLNAVSPEMIKKTHDAYNNQHDQHRCIFHQHKNTIQYIQCTYLLANSCVLVYYLSHTNSVSKQFKDNVSYDQSDSHVHEVVSLSQIVEPFIPCNLPKYEWQCSAAVELWISNSLNCLWWVRTYII